MVAHPILLRGLGLDGAGSAPTILQRTDQAFIPAVLGELAGDDGLATIARSIASARDEARILKLFQPVHRTFHVALFEVVCDHLSQPHLAPFGQPRLDPERIESAGLVVRRLAVDGEGRRKTSEVKEGWMRTGESRGLSESVRGWVSLSAEGEQQDPDPQFRLPELSAGHPEVNRLLALHRGTPEPLAESVSPLFVAPPEVCAAVGKTILYGLVPVASPEFSETPPSTTYDPEDVRQLLPEYLLRGNQRQVPLAGETLDQRAAERVGLAESKFMDMLHTLRRFDAFDGSPEAQQLLAALNGISLTVPTGQQPAGDFLRQAVAVLVERQGGGQTVTMPLAWPPIQQARYKAILQATAALLETRMNALSSGQPRFEDVGREYRLRAFVRVRRKECCPPEIIWSPYSEPFTIAPWYESGAAPPVRVSLPNALDRDFMKKARPNVSFFVPASLMDFFESNDAKDLVSGAGSSGSGNITLDWICGFNIPFITICAFIVLNIFLKLFNIIFWWLAFIKICLPIPRRS
jgi:hypothetical protein